MIATFGSSYLRVPHLNNQGYVNNEIRVPVIIYIIFQCLLSSDSPKI